MSSRLMFGAAFAILTMAACQKAVTVTPQASSTATLSDDGLMALDFNSDHVVGLRARVVAQRDVPGAGVEFDIRFPGNTKADDTVFFVSSKRGGAQRFADLDLAQLQKFALKFSLVAMNGNPAPTEHHGSVEVGAIVNGAFKPEFVRFVAEQGQTRDAISATMQREDLPKTLFEIGFMVRLFALEEWSPDGTLLTIRVEPVSDAQPLQARAAPECGATQVNTVTDDELMAAELRGEHFTLVNRRDVEGPGVEFELEMKDPSGGASLVLPTKDTASANGLFQAEVTLVAVNGDDKHRGMLVVGAMVDDAYRPLDLAFGPHASVIAATAMKPLARRAIRLEPFPFDKNDWRANDRLRLRVAPSQVCLPVPAR